MAILAIFTGDGFTKHEEMRKEVDWERNHPKGVIVHATGSDDSRNIRVVDI
jgi:hypothetical protein